MRMRIRSQPAPVAAAAGIAAFASRHAPGWRMDPRAEPWHKLVLVLAGGCRLEEADRSIALGEDRLVLVPAGTVHRFVDPPGAAAELAGLCLDPQRLAAACGGDWPAVMRRLRGGIALDLAARELALRTIADLLAPSGRGAPARRLAAWGRTVELIALAWRAERPRRTAPAEDRMRAAVAWLDEHHAQPCAIDALAARAGLGRRAFAGRFRRLTGESVLARVLRLRLDRSARLLRAGMPVASAALASGFGDLSGFYRHFRRRFSTTPGCLRSGAQPGATSR